MYYVGIDVGGMSIKGGIVNSSGEIIFKSVCKIKDKQAMPALDFVMEEVVNFAKSNGVALEGAGIGVPCIFDKKTGVVSYGNNLDFKGINLKERFLNKYGLRLEIANDAAAAALGELKFGGAKGYQNAVLITIGTGVGCGIILGGKIISTNSSAVGELSHTILQVGGRKCACGKKGCVEAYCSMTALYKDVKREMLKNKNSLLWQTVKPNAIDGKAFFEWVGKDQTADRVFNRFIKYLGVTVVNVANLLRPDIILIGGGVSAQGEKIIKPLEEYLNQNVFAPEYTAKIPVRSALNGNDAGILGSASLAID
ncbi:MAG: ROK family protein [Clostridia bacterium]|nr:ROK family protein [Clostridia bacterium]